MNVAVVATRNEAATIGPLVHILRQYASQVFVSDESDYGDTTPFEAAMAGACVITASLGGERGLGPSLIRAYREAYRCGARRVIQIDAGGSHDPDEIPYLLAEDAHIVIGSRFVPGSTYIGRPWRSRASRVYGYSMYARSGLPVRDWTSGYRVFSRHAIDLLIDAPYEAKMHGWQAEVLLHAHRYNLSVCEVPIHYQAGDTSLRLPHVWEALKVR